MNSKFTWSIVFAASIILIGCTSSEPGPAGMTSLVKITHEQIGTNCISGGFKIETGVDDNKNSTLDNDEIQNSAYVCNGVKGNDGSNVNNGSNGLTSLIKITDESAGGNCSSGGHRIDTGIDDNANVILDAAEIDNTIYLCNESDGTLVNYGKHTLVLSGNLTDEQAAEIIAKDLGTATQEVRILHCTRLTTVDLSQLESATSIRIFNNAALETVNLSGLKSLVGQLQISDSPELNSLNVDALEYFAAFNDSETSGGSWIYDTKLINLSFPSLVNLSGINYVGHVFHLEGNTFLQSVSFPELTEAKSLAIYGSLGSLTSFMAPKLAKGSVYVGGIFTTFSLPELTEGNVSVVSHLLTSLSLPKLTKGDVGIYSSGLTSLTIPELMEGRLVVNDNANLRSLNVPKFLEGHVEILRNSIQGSLTIPEIRAGSVFISEKAVTSVILPKLVNLQEIYIEAPISTFTLPTLISFGPDSFTIHGGLSSEGVNAILSNLAQINNPAVTWSRIDLRMTPSAPPTGQGLTDKATLQANGNTVITNED